MATEEVNEKSGLAIDEETGSKFHTTRGGDVIDLANIPGKKKMALIYTGEVRPAVFVTPSNMPGKKLAAMREAHEKRLSETPSVANPFPVGSYVVYKGQSVEVLKVDPEKGLLLEVTKNDKLGRVWVKPSDKLERG